MDVFILFYSSGKTPPKTQRNVVYAFHGSEVHTTMDWGDQTATAQTNNQMVINKAAVVSGVSTAVNVKHHKLVILSKENDHWTRGHKGECSSLLFYYK